MKMAKIFAIMFAVVLAVFCLSGPFAFGGDEHPWDEEGGDDGGDLDGAPPDADPDQDPTAKAGSGTAMPSDGSGILYFISFTLTTSLIL